MGESELRAELEDIRASLASLREMESSLTKRRDDLIVEARRLGLTERETAVLAGVSRGWVWRVAGKRK